MSPPSAHKKGPLKNISPGAYLRNITAVVLKFKQLHVVSVPALKISNIPARKFRLVAAIGRHKNIETTSLRQPIKTTY